MQKPSFTPAAILRTLGGCMTDVSGLKPISGGEESQAYRFRSESQTYVIRVNRSASGFEKDAFAFRRFARRNLPIPEVLYIGEIDRHFYCISENMPGVTLQDLRPEDLPSMLALTARILNAISESEVNDISGFGPFDSSGLASHESWRDFLTSVADPQRFDWAALGPQVHTDSVNRFLDRLDGLAPYCPETHQLVHGDFGSNNVLTDSGQITGVVDWSEALVGDPLYDVAGIFFWRTWLECMEQQARYFEACLGNLPHLSLCRLLCYQLRIGLAEIYRNAIEGKTEAAAWATSRCCELI